MKRLILLLPGLLLLIAIALPSQLLAQAKPVTGIDQVSRKGETVRFTLSSSKPFIFGGNKYVLHIGEREFSLTEQHKKDGKGYITFLIPAGEFNDLTEGVGIFLTYGKAHMTESQLAELSRQNPRCWSLGTFSKKLLTK